jgi:hypothetical protein
MLANAARRMERAAAAAALRGLRLQRCERAAVRWCRWRNIAEIRFRVGLTCFGEKRGTAHNVDMCTCDSDTSIFFLTGFAQCVVKK